MYEDCMRYEVYVWNVQHWMGHGAVDQLAHLRRAMGIYNRLMVKNFVSMKLAHMLHYYSPSVELYFKGIVKSSCRLRIADTPIG